MPRETQEDQMKKSKRERLERAGFAVGDTQEFLGLGAAEMAVIDVRVALAQAVRDRRSRRLKVSQTEFGRRVGISESRVVKMEAGDPSVTIDLLMGSLFKSGSTPEEVARVLLSSMLGTSPPDGSPNERASDRTRLPRTPVAVNSG